MVKELGTKPPIFTGEDKHLTRGFINAFEEYLLLNGGIYDDQLKRNTFLLTLVQGLKVEPWKESVREKVKKNGISNADLVKNFRETFGVVHEADEAKRKIATLEHKDWKVNEYINEFKILAATAGYTTHEDAPLLIDLFT